MTLEEVKRHIRIDFDDDDDDIEALIEQAEILVDTCCGTGYKNNEKGLKIAELLYKKIVNDLYDNRGTTISNGYKRDSITNNLFEVLTLIGGDE